MTKKQAQYLDGFSVETDSFLADDALLADDQFDLDGELDAFMGDDEKAKDDSQDLVAFEVEEEDPNVRIFVLPAVPGGEFQGDLEDEVELEVDEDEDIIVDDDPFNWKPSNFLDCLQQMLQGVPKHSGRDSVGLERAISYLEMVDKEISKAMRVDYKGEIDFSKVEEARDELYDGIVRLQERLDKVKGKKYPGRKGKSKKKKADAQDEMVKEAKHAHVGNHVVSVPLIISHVARTCLNSMISAGKDIEDTFDKLATKFKFTPREEAETMQLLADMGYPMRRPRGYFRDEEIDYTSTDNHDWAQNFPA